MEVPRPAWSCGGDARGVETGMKVLPKFRLARVALLLVGLAALCHFALPAGVAQAPDSHPEFSRSTHAAAGLTCTSCHLPPADGGAKGQLKDKQIVLCATCHDQVPAAFSLSSHHPVAEGKVQCSDCHNVHAAAVPNGPTATAARNQSCIKCHAKAGGPFTFEHPAVKAQGCLACHEAHGAKNPKLLIRANINQVCMFCHTMATNFTAPGVPQFHSQAKNPQACTSCHAEVHGSNTSKIFLK